MRVCICSSLERQSLLSSSPTASDPDLLGWKRGGDNITYKLSKINYSSNPSYQYESYDDEDESQEYDSKNKKFYQLSFTYELEANDET